MNSLRKTLALYASAIATIGDNYPYTPPAPQGRTYGAVPHPDTRQLREFTVKGQKIMAYSKKDAIKRMKHQKL